MIRWRMVAHLVLSSFFFRRLGFLGSMGGIQGKLFPFPFPFPFPSVSLPFPFRFRSRFRSRSLSLSLPFTAEQGVVSKKTQIRANLHITNTIMVFVTLKPN